MNPSFPFGAVYRMKDCFGILPRDEGRIGTRGIEPLLPNRVLADDLAAKEELAESYLRKIELASPMLIP